MDRNQAHNQQHEYDAELSQLLGGFIEEVIPNVDQIFQAEVAVQTEIFDSNTNIDEGRSQTMSEPAPYGGLFDVIAPFQTVSTPQIDSPINTNMGTSNPMSEQSYSHGAGLFDMVAPYVQLASQQVSESEQILPPLPTLRGILHQLLPLIPDDALQHVLLQMVQHIPEQAIWQTFQRSRDQLVQQVSQPLSDLDFVQAWADVVSEDPSQHQNWRKTATKVGSTEQVVKKRMKKIFNNWAERKHAELHGCLKIYDETLEKVNAWRKNKKDSQIQATSRSKLQKSVKELADILEEVCSDIAIPPISTDRDNIGLESSGAGSSTNVVGDSGLTSNELLSLADKWYHCCKDWGVQKLPREFYRKIAYDLNISPTVCMSGIKFLQKQRRMLKDHPMETNVAANLGRLYEKIVKNLDLELEKKKEPELHKAKELAKGLLRRSQESGLVADGGGHEEAAAAED